ncbi:MAG: TetR/AcrR family transcriptional regulator [Pseudomonadales bacterium]|nr:TetR/AcrR family transcriptional regulator [Pseudomonadales bacterium]
MTTSTIRRRRLSPEARKAELLDAAFDEIIEYGLARLTIEQIARRANSSKALVYSYYPNLQALLQALYEREVMNLQRQHSEALQAPHDFEGMVKTTARIAREGTDRRQQLLARLEHDPGLMQLISQEDQRARADIVNYLTARITGEYDIPPHIAECATRLALKYETGRDTDQTDQDEIWATMIVGAMKALEHRYGAGDKS